MSDDETLTLLNKRIYAQSALATGFWMVEWRDDDLYGFAPDYTGDALTKSPDMTFVPKPPFVDDEQTANELWSDLYAANRNEKRFVLEWFGAYHVGQILTWWDFTVLSGHINNLCERAETGFRLSTHGSQRNLVEWFNELLFVLRVACSKCGIAPACPERITWEDAPRMTEVMNAIRRDIFALAETLGKRKAS